MSYANMDSVPTQTAGTSELLASDWNTYVRDNFDSIKFGHVVCTSATRPVGIAEGTMVYETDTNLIYIYNGSSWTQNNLTPVGLISPFGGGTAPNGWLLCNGDAVSQTTYAALFAVVGTTYDVTSPGAGNFRVPDLRGRMAVGLGTNTDVDALGDSDGEATVASRRPKHRHTVTDPGHTHSITQFVSNTTDPPDGAVVRTGFAGSFYLGGTHSCSTVTTGVTIGPQTNSIIDGPAYLTVQYIIKY